MKIASLLMFCVLFVGCQTDRTKQALIDIENGVDIQYIEMKNRN